MAEPQREWGLVMPYVVCQSQGGPYEDQSFVAGARFGGDMAELRAEKPATWQSYVYPGMVPQYDLLAMEQGYTMTSEPWDEHPDEWVLVTFTRSHTGRGQ
jgi:hypothetical protein